MAAPSRPTRSVALTLMQEAGTVEQRVDEGDWQRFQGIQRLSDHWVREDWPPSRHYVTWYVVFRDSAVQAYAARFQRELADLDCLDPIPANGLHMTIQGVAYRDQLDDEQINAIAQRGASAAPTWSPSTSPSGRSAASELAPSCVPNRGHPSSSYGIGCGPPSRTYSAPAPCRRRDHRSSRT